jgi:hypothetical protein
MGQLEALQAFESLEQLVLVWGWYLYNKIWWEIPLTNLTLYEYDAPH